MIYKFPYTDLYSLNLDWMIQAMKEMQSIVEPLDRVVNSVNNMTGDVVITKAFLLNILESMVSKFNGRAGDVTLTAADVNNTMIDITWTSDPGDVIGDIQQNVLDQMYAAGKRVLIFLNNLSVPDTIYFLTLVGDVVTPQIYSPTAALAGVASFNGQTGNVTATGSDLDTANDDDTPISESIGDLQTAVGEQSQQIGNVPLPTTAQTLTGAIAEEKQHIDNLYTGIAQPKIEGNVNNTGDTIYKNAYFWLNGVLCVAKNNIANGETFTSGTNYEIIGNGLGNYINDSMQSKVNPHVLTLKPYGTFSPDGTSTICVSFDFAVASNRLYIECFDNAGALIGLWSVALTRE